MAVMKYNNGQEVTTVSQIATDKPVRHSEIGPRGGVVGIGQDGGLVGKIDYSKVEEKIGYHVNPNLLDNWYFVGGGTVGKFPVNQRGETLWNLGNETIYLFDRWLSGWGDNLELTPDGLHFLDNCTIGEPLPSEIITALTNHQVTVSALFSDKTLVSKTDTLREGQNLSDESNALTLIWGWGGKTLVFNLRANKTVVAVKLELGSQQTLAHQENGKWVLNEIPDYGEQLRRCQRYYYQSWDEASNLTDPYTGCQGIAKTELTVPGVKFPQSMAHVPKEEKIVIYNPKTGTANEMCEYLTDTKVQNVAAEHITRFGFVIGAPGLTIGDTYNYHYSVSCDL